jgi:hypothetical protein
MPPKRGYGDYLVSICCTNLSLADYYISNSKALAQELLWLHLVRGYLKAGHGIISVCMIIQSTRVCTHAKLRAIYSE